MTKIIVSVVMTLSAMAGGAALWYGPPRPGATEQGVQPAPHRATAVAAAKASAPATQPANPPQDDFRVIADRNIFLAAQGHGAAAAPSTAPSPSAFVLKGVAQRGRQFVAFVEQPGGGGVLEVRVNHALGRGTVRGISLRALDYELDGKLARVEVGQPVGGAPPQAATVAAAPLPVTAATRPSPPDVPKNAAERDRLAAGSRRTGR
jgi:hypothetical protein